VMSSGYTGVNGLEHLFQAKQEGASPAAISEAPRAVSYVRVSNVKQLRTGMDIDADGNSLATQRQFAKRTADELGAEIAHEFTERGRSAQSIEHRPAFRELLEYVENHPKEIDYVIVYARSRAFRNYEDASVTEARLRRRGVQIISCTERFSNDPDTAFLEKTFKDWMNTKTVRDNGRDIAVKMQHKAERGGFNGRAKLGYLNDKVKVDGYFVNTITVDTERGPLIRWGFEAYSSGNYSLPQLQRELTDLGLTTRETATFKSQPVSLSQLAKILRDPMYTGVILYKGTLYPGRHEPLITKELYLRVQDVLNGRVRRGLRDRVHHHYLRGLIFCQRCQQRGVTSQLVYTEAEGHGGVYEYFFCARRKSGECDLPYLTVTEVERAVRVRIDEEHLSQTTIAELRVDLQEAMSARDEVEASVHRNLRRQLKRLEGQEDRIIELVSDGDLPVEKLKARLRALALQREHLKERLTRTEEDLRAGVENIDVYLDLLSEPGQLYDRADDLSRRQLVEAFYSTILLDVDDEVKVEADPHPGVGALSSIDATVSANNKADPHLSVGVRLVRAASVFTTLFRPMGSNKGSLVAGAGFEPTTSGL
jgi:site-specific DNA recombinase